MAFGDPFNAGANHGDKENLAATTDTSTPGFGTTSGNSMLVVVRTGATPGTVSVDISENSGTNFNSATLAGATNTVTSAGTLSLFYYPSLTGAANGNVRVRVNTTNSVSIRYCWCEYTGAFSYDATTFTNGGAGVANAFNSGNLVTSATRTLIGGAIFGRNATVVTAPIIAGTTNSLTWTIRDEMDSLVSGRNTVNCAIMDFNGGGQASGTYACLGTLSNSGTDNWGAAIYSFQQVASGAFVRPTIIVKASVTKLRPGQVKLLRNPAVVIPAVRGRQPLVRTSSYRRAGKVILIHSPVVALRGTQPIIRNPSYRRGGKLLLVRNPPPFRGPTTEPIVKPTNYRRPSGIQVIRNPFVGFPIAPLILPIVKPALSVHRPGLIFHTQNGLVSAVVVAVPKAQPPIIVTSSYRRPGRALVLRNPFTGTIPTRQPTPIVKPRPFFRPKQTSVVQFPLIGITALPVVTVPGQGYLTVGPIEVLTNVSNPAVAPIYLDNGLTRPVHHLIVTALSGGVQGQVALVTTPDLIHWGAPTSITFNGPGTYTTSWVGGARYISAEILSLFSGSVSVWVSSSVTTGG